MKTTGHAIRQEITGLTFRPMPLTPMRRHIVHAHLVALKEEYNARVSIVIPTFGGPDMKVSLATLETLVRLTSAGTRERYPDGYLKLFPVYEQLLRDADRTEVEMDYGPDLATFVSTIELGN